MLRLSGPTLLTLSLAVPSASLALGLGDIRVDSALHQPFVGQIELLGATPDELGRLRAEIASEDVFERYGLEHAPFIYGTTLALGEDPQGRPVLNLRSTERFTEPVVTLLVDIHTPNGEFIREYTVFLDPPEFASKRAGLESTSAAPSAAPATTAASATTVAPAATAETASTITALERAPAAPAIKLLERTYTVARRDTLDHIVSIAGAHSRIDRHRMMVAIFRANPAAFQGNFNRLRTGVTLHLPASEQLSAISAAEANREYDAQMAGWHTPGHRLQPAAPAPVTATANGDSIAADPTAPIPVVPNPVLPNPTTDAKQETESDETERARLTLRVASLEKSLEQMREELKQPLVVEKPAPVAAAPTQKPVPVAVAPTQKPAPVAVAPTRVPEMAAGQDDSDDEDEPTSHRGMWLVPIAAGLALTLIAGVWFYRRRRNTDPNRVRPQAQRETRELDPAQTSEMSLLTVKNTLATPVSTAKAQGARKEADSNAGSNDSSWIEDSFSTPIADLLANDPVVSANNLTASTANEATVELPVDSTAKLPSPVGNADTTVMLAPDLNMAGDTAEQKFSFFNPESTLNTEHVVMSDGLTAARPFVERRKNPAEVLLQAIEREPQRSDLRLKLLELYYTAAAENRQAFLQATRQLAKSEELATAEDWARIADMGRTIAPDDELFAAELDDKRVA